MTLKTGVIVLLLFLAGGDIKWKKEIGRYFDE